MAATSRIVAAKTPFLGQGRAAAAAANASPLRDVAAAAAGGRITMVRAASIVYRSIHGPWPVDGFNQSGKID